MTGRYIHYLAGGGLGDIFREAYYHNAVGILKRWKLENPTAHLTVLTMSHNPAAADLLTGQDWIDEVVDRRFPLETTWAWESAYALYEADFWGKTELRFTLPERRTLYNARWMRGRPFGPQVKMIDPIGVPWAPVLSEYERAVADAAFTGRVVLHPGAGQQSRQLPPPLSADLIEQIPKGPLVIGANFDRDQHGFEVGRTFNPRLLLAGLSKAKAVIGTESSVWYLATMLGVPACLLYAPDATYDRVQRGLDDWDWYYNQHPKNLALKLPLDDATPILRWLETV